LACHVLTAGLCAVLERVRAQIKARGAKTIRGLGRTFRNFDSFDGNHKIDRDEFYSGLCEIQIRISRQEADSLMALFDTDGDGCVNFDEFLVGIRVSFLPSCLSSPSPLPDLADRQASVPLTYLTNPD
jgi:hypothetical protein